MQGDAVASELRALAGALERHGDWLLLQDQQVSPNPQDSKPPAGDSSAGIGGPR